MSGKQAANRAGEPASLFGSTDAPAVAPGVGKSWRMFAVRNAHEHLSSVSPYKALVETSRSMREDSSACSIVEVDVIVRAVIPERMPVKKRGKK